MIRYLDRDQICPERWDKTIGNSTGRVVYALSWYLDAVSPDWGALVKGDYEAVMPLPVSWKWGLSFVTQPYLCQQLGVFSPSNLPDDELEMFLSYIPHRFLVVRLSCNVSNHFASPLNIIYRKTFILNLNKSCENLRKDYSPDAGRNLHKAKRKQVLVCQISDFEIVRHFLEENRNYFDTIKLEKMVSAVQVRGEIKCYGARVENSLVSVAIFVRSFDSFVYLCSATSNLGRKTSANYLLIDTFIADHSGQDLVLDFEGSSIDGIARFFSGFGATPVTFPSLRFLNVPLLNKTCFSRF